MKYRLGTGVFMLLLICAVLWGVQVVHAQSMDAFFEDLFPVENASTTPVAIITDLLGIVAGTSTEATSSEEVLLEEMVTEESIIEEIVEEPVVEEATPVENFMQDIVPVPVYVPAPVPAKKEVVIDEEAKHKCLVNPFSITIPRNGSRHFQTVTLEGERFGAESLVLGGAPQGIHMVLDGGDASYTPVNKETVVSLEVSADETAAIGNFSVSLLYTVGGSTTVCQTNIVSQ